MTLSQIIQSFRRILFCFLVFTLILISLFHTPLFSSSLLFYRGIALIAVASAFTLLCLFLFDKKTHSTSFETWFLCTIASACLHLCFFVVVPVTLDRSQSTFLLQLMERQNRPMNKMELEQFFVRHYIYENDAIGRRIDEQIRSGNFVSNQEGYTLTSQGKLFLDFSRTVLLVFGIKSEVVDTKTTEPEK